MIVGEDGVVCSFIGLEDHDRVMFGVGESLSQVTGRLAQEVAPGASEQIRNKEGGLENEQPSTAEGLVIENT